MSRKQKLELTWIGKEERPRLEPRILIEKPEFSFHAQSRRDGDLFSNTLIQGDNLLALRALEQDFTGKFECVCIDPPYNTGAAFTHYDDGVEHSLWLSLMRDRLVIMHRLLTETGTIWITVDDNEAHYLKVMCDEIFGRACFVATVIWEKADSPRNSARQFSTDHDYILVYSKTPEWTPKRLPRTEAANSIYSNPDNDPRGPWLPGDPYANKPYSRGRYVLTGPTGRTFSPPPGRYWRVSEERIRDLDKEGRIWWGPKKDARPSIKRYLSEVGDLVPRTIWTKEDVGSNRTSKNELRALFPGAEAFGTPKPEKLIQRILQIATREGDLVLDSFAGSGTTGAVAHKMRRRWIMVELGDHATTLIVPRLRKIINGDDPGGITADAGWEGGGGFRFCSLAPSLLERDKRGNWIVSKEYNREMLAEAMCKHMGFSYAPTQDAAEYWKHGSSSERDFIYVTSQAITHGMLAALSHDVGPDRHLLICCKAYSGNPDAYDNLTVRKIPQAVLANCEWDRDDYSLRIAALPVAEAAKDEALMFNGDADAAPRRTRKRRVAEKSNEATLFDATAEVGK